VLPLTNLSSDREQEYFADGMTEELIAQLAKIRSLRVISRTSIMNYKVRENHCRSARELNVLAVVEGSVRRVGDRVRITVQLIHGPTDRHLWSETYERDVRDALALQSDVAKAIAREIKIRLTPEEKAHLTPGRQVEPEAYAACLLGNYWYNIFTNEGLEKSAKHFSRSLEKGPEYAAAHAGLARSFSALAITGLMPTGEAMSRATREALRALDLDPGIAEAHVVLGGVAMAQWDWARAEAEIRRALALDPNSVAAHTALSLYLVVMGRAKEAIDESKPPATSIRSWRSGLPTLAGVYQLAGEYDRALAEAQKALKLSPDLPVAQQVVGIVYLLQNRSEEGLHALERARDLTGGSPEPLIALAYARSGRREEALKLLSEIAGETKDASKPVPSGKIALAYAELGLKDQAFDWLQRASQEHDTWLLFIKLGQFLDPLRSDPRFADLLKQMGLPP
jgi:TolB-like protein/Flp pilus assembly protein TadD